MKPLMTRREIRIFKKELLSRRNKDVVDVLEWGSGGSTLYFTEFMKSNSIPYHWTSIEYNSVWYQKVKALVSDNSNIDIVLFDTGNSGLKQRHTNMDDYIDYPKTLNKKFDVIFVDGRKRRRCVLLAKQLLKDDGVVFLHDAQRKYYQCVFREFENQHLVGPSLWRGLNTNASCFVKVKNIFIHFFFLMIRKLFIYPYHVAKGLARIAFTSHAK